MLTVAAPHFAVVDVDCGLPLEERQRVCAALQRQIREEFCAAWGVGGSAYVRAVTPSAPVLPGEVVVYLLRTLSQAGALGFHDRLKNGDGVIYVSPPLAKSFGDEWSAVVSHELLEYLVDPYLMRCVQTEEGFWDFEVCDRVQNSSYSIDGVAVSNFSLPACFEPPVDLTGVKFDYLGHTTKPNSCEPGGYRQKFDAKSGWTTMGMLSPYRLVLANLGLSRGKRRAERGPQPGFFRRLWRRMFG